MNITIAVNIEVDEEKNNFKRILNDKLSISSIYLVVKLSCIEFFIFRKRHKNSCLTVHFA